MLVKLGVLCSSALGRPLGVPEEFDTVEHLVTLAEWSTQRFASAVEGAERQRRAGSGWPQLTELL